MRELPHTHGCYICGEANPLGLNLRFYTDGQIVHTRFTPRAEHAGFKGVVHGGVLMAVLDEIMVWACAVRAGRFAVSAEICTRFLRPVRPHEPLTVSGELLANRRGRLFEARGCAVNAAGDVVAEATGKYLPIKPTDLAPLEADLIGDWAWLTVPAPPAKPT